jgi:hypothetical protein
MQRQIFICLIFALSFPFGSGKAVSSLSDNDPPLQLFSAAEDVIDSVESLETLNSRVGFPSDLKLIELPPGEAANCCYSSLSISAERVERHFCRPPPISFM